MNTMADVARLAGVSVTTVSHVLNNTRTVSPETVERVRRAVQATGYSRNTVARALATHSTMLIGVVMSFLTNPFFAPLVAQIERTARRRGYTLLLTDSHDSPVVEAEQIQILLDHRVDGVVIAPASQDGDRSLDILAARGVPTVLVDRIGDPRFDEVAAEAVVPVSQLVSHLVNLGHTRIGFISGKSHLWTTAARLEGYKQGLAAAGLTFQRSLVRSGASQAEPAKKSIAALMRLDNPPTAVVCANNAMTVGTLTGLRELHIDVPTQFALVSYDDLDLADLINPPITCMAQPISEMGALATKLLLRRIGGQQGTPERHMLSPTFQHRQSCGCPSEGGHQ